MVMISTPSTCFFLGGGGVLKVGGPGSSRLEDLGGPLKGKTILVNTRLPGLEREHLVKLVVALQVFALPNIAALRKFYHFFVWRRPSEMKRFVLFSPSNTNTSNFTRFPVKLGFFLELETVLFNFLFFFHTWIFQFPFFKKKKNSRKNRDILISVKKKKKT